jgi:hypothetical protein
MKRDLFHKLSDLDFLTHFQSFQLCYELDARRRGAAVREAEFLKGT